MLWSAGGGGSEWDGELEMRRWLESGLEVAEVMRAVLRKWFGGYPMETLPCSRPEEVDWLVRGSGLPLTVSGRWYVVPRLPRGVTVVYDGPDVREAVPPCARRGYRLPALGVGE